MFLHNTTFERDGVNDIDARTLWHYQSIVVSSNLLSTTPGQGTAYLTAFRDDKGFCGFPFLWAHGGLYRKNLGA